MTSLAVDRRRAVRRWVLARRPGGAQTLVAILAAALTVTVIVASSRTALTVPLAAVGWLLFAGATLAGAPRMVGFAGAPVLGSALSATRGSDDVAWLSSIAVGCLWYVAVEVAWHAIERRACDERARAVDLRRAQEVLTVVIAALGVGVAAYGLAFAAPIRTLGIQAVVVLGFLWALLTIVRSSGARQSE